MSNKLKRNLGKKKAAETAQHQMVPMFQVPIVLDRDIDNVIGFVTVDPTKVPAGSDWGLQPGVDNEDKIIVFSTVEKGKRSSFTK